MPSSQKNRRWLLKNRPGPGLLDENCLQLDVEDIPPLKEGEYLIKNKLISLDPTQMMWLRADSYMPRVQINEVVRSVALGEVVDSRSARYPKGAIVHGLLGWQEYSLRSGQELFPDMIIPAGIDSKAAVSVFGLTGMTAFFGMQNVAQVKSGDVVLVSGAAGATGSIAAQIAKIMGAKKVIGIAGGKRKCDWLLEVAKLDAVIDYKGSNVLEGIRAAAPEGIDVYFDNVGGKILDFALANLRLNARVALCGAISTYDGSDGSIVNYLSLVIKRASMQGFLISDYISEFGNALDKLGLWAAGGLLKYEVDIQFGIENAPKVFNRLFSGDNLGKQLLQLDEG